MWLIPGYQIVQEIHRGKKRVIYRARREHDDQPVIVKTLLDDFPEAVDIAGVKREHEILQHLRIDGIARLYGLEWQHNRLALILQDIGGESLRQLLDSQKIDLAACLNIGMRLADTLVALHRNNIIHKDLTPANIIVNLATNQVQLIDFSMASRLPQESQKISHPNLLEGTLAYMSPEQTGRMNRAMDYRTDFYTFGVTFYEMLTGRLPFYSADALELVHSHIAKIPTPPHELNPSVPAAVSAIVMKLLAKTAEERYNSAYGLKTDLETCWTQWQARGKIDGLVPGLKDFSDRFQIPQKLYGREPEIAILLAAFDRVSQGATEIMLVSGYSGIGKSALVNEVHKPIVRQRGYFIAGKFDQFKRNIPHSAIIQALQELVRQLLTESEPQIAAWKEKLLRALGANGQVIIEVIPEIELIIGRQPAVPELPPAESQNRFNLIFQRFIKVFTQPEHPLVIFLDDLQWADAATLKLLQALTTDRNIHHLFLIGACRDNEVSAAHPLLLTLAEIERGGATLNNMTLSPLAITHLEQFVADTLRCGTDKSKPLAGLILQKTAGNPFFVTQFLKSLHQERLLTFDQDNGQWLFDPERIQRLGMTDNVVALMANKIQKLLPAVQQAAKRAACIGNQFDLKTLAIVSEKSWQRIAGDLWELVREGLILPIDHAYELMHADDPESVTISYKFLHDRVQQAAYALIPEEQKKAVHLQVGRLMLEYCNEAARQEKIFDIVNHLNVGAELITDADERAVLAGLNLQAGQKAKLSTAYKPALSYFNLGLNFLSGDGWNSHYDLTFTLHRELAECDYLCGNFDEAERYFDLLLSKARTKLERAEIHNMRIIQYENMAKYSQAVQSGREGLKLFGIVLPETAEEKKAAFDTENQAIQRHLGKRKIEELVHLPVMTDPEMQMSMKLLMTMWAPAYIAGDNQLTVLISAIMVRLSLAHGNTRGSCYGYVTHAITVGTGMGDFKSGYEFGRLALAVNEYFHEMKLRAKVHHMFSCFINFWRQPIRTCFPHSKEAFRSGLETGDFVYATYAAIHESWHAFFCGSDLSQYQKDYAPNVSFLTQIKNYSFADAQRLILHWGLNLQGLTESKFSLNDKDFDEKAYWQAYNGVPFFETFYDVTQLHIFYLFENYAEAQKAALKAECVIHALVGTLWMTTLCFYQALTLAALYASADAEKRREYWQKLEALQKQMKTWADNSPENFLHEYLLISAEMARLTGKTTEAMASYEQAIRSARENGIMQHEALANELYAKFWLQRENEKIAGVYMAEAHYGYQLWGAQAKAKDLAERYAHLLYPRRAESAAISPPALAGRRSMEALDLNAVIKAAQAISGEMLLSRLLEKLMHIVVENAGAQKGMLILEKGGELVVAAEKSVGAKDLGAKNQGELTALHFVPVKSCRNLSQAMVNYVKRIGASLVLADAVNDEKFANDPYVLANQPKSILCMPILHQGKFAGILYLENNLTGAAFTPDRIAVIEILCAQAAISLENARLYEEMKQEIAERQRAEAELMKSEERFRTLFESAPIGISINNAEGKFLQVNRAFAEMMGYGEDELTQISFKEITFAEDLAESRQVFGELVAGKRTQFRVEKRYSQKNGEILWATTVCAAIRDADGRFLYTFAMVTDISERKRAEMELRKAHDELELRVEERTHELSEANKLLTKEIKERLRMEEALRQAKEAAESANRAKSEFLARMSHELRTPLNSILGYTQIFKRDQSLTEAQQEGIAIMHKSGEHLLGLINEVLDLSKIEAQQMELHMADFILPEFLNSLVEIFRERAEQKGLDFVYEALSPLPVAVRGDAQRLRQVLINLLGNAIKFTERGSVALKVGYHETLSNQTLIRFQVEDTGIGIAPEHWEKIFQPFHQVSDDRHFIEGTGLGLTISRELVRMMGSELKLKSTPGQGSVFWMDLDLQEISRETAVPAIGTRTITGYHGAPRKILVVDDKPENRAVLVNLLVPLGFELLEAADGLEGLRKAIVWQPDLILMDLIMPVIDGFEATRRIRQTPALQNVIVIALSASVFEHNRQQSLKAGCNDFMPKPFRAENLLEQLRMHLGLEWVYEESEKGEKAKEDAAAIAPSLIGPPAAEAAALFDLAMMGDIKGILQRVESIQKLGDQFRPFAGELRRLAKEYRMKEIRELVKPFMQ
jgi:PAS domain S-box-containing protein